MSLRPENPIVSVLMPVHNVDAYVGAAVESIMAQSLRRWELIVVDDGSTDGTSRLLQRFARQDSRVRVLRNDRCRGIVRSLNRGLHVCRGQYVARMDGDDISLPDRFRRQVDWLDSHPNVMALGTAVRYMYSDGRLSSVRRACTPNRSMLRGNPLLHPTVMLRRRALTERGLSYRPEYRYAEDYYLWLELKQAGALDALNEELLLYRVHAASSRALHCRAMIVATLRVKWHAMSRLGIRPAASDVAQMLAEAVLMMLPQELTFMLYCKYMNLANSRECL